MFQLVTIVKKKNLENENRSFILNLHDKKKLKKNIKKLC